MSDKGSIETQDGVILEEKEVMYKSKITLPYLQSLAALSAIIGGSALIFGIVFMSAAHNCQYLLLTNMLFDAFTGGALSFFGIICFANAITYLAYTLEFKRYGQIIEKVDGKRK